MAARVDCAERRTEASCLTGELQALREMLEQRLMQPEDHSFMVDATVVAFVGNFGDGGGLHVAAVAPMQQLQLELAEVREMPSRGLVSELQQTSLTDMLKAAFTKLLQQREFGPCTPVKTPGAAPHACMPT